MYNLLRPFQILRLSFFFYYHGMASGLVSTWPGVMCSILEFGAFCMAFTSTFSTPCLYSAPVFFQVVFTSSHHQPLTLKFLLFLYRRNGFRDESHSTKTFSFTVFSTAIHHTWIRILHILHYFDTDTASLFI